MTRASSIALCLYLACSMAAAVPAAAQSDAAQSDAGTSARLEALFGAHEPYGAFLISLKEAVAARDKAAVAAVTAYPFETTIAGAPVTLESAEEFVRRYDQLLTPAVVAAVEEQAYATLFANAEGVMIGDGEIWFSGVCADGACSAVSVRIIAINPPDDETPRPAGMD